MDPFFLLLLEIWNR